MSDLRLRADNISLNVDGKTIELKNAQLGNADLNTALDDPTKYKEFIADPKGFAAIYGLTIDDNAANHLSVVLSGTQNVSEVDSKVFRDPSRVGATVWAVASGSYSVSSSKVAVAFKSPDLVDRQTELDRLQQLSSGAMGSSSSE